MMMLLEEKLFLAIMILIMLHACSNRSAERDTTQDRYAKSQQEVTEVINSIVRDAETANLEGLMAIHLDNERFTKFGPRQFERQDLHQTNASESAFFGSISEYQQEIRDLKIDVFDDMAIATYHPHVSFVRDGDKKTVSGRQTFVFLRTKDTWKLVHEHGTVRP
jgi:ketosteroid isomerase-like protein